MNNFFLFICDVIYTSIQQELVVIEALENFAKKISGMGIKVGVQYAVIIFFFFKFSSHVFNCHLFTLFVNDSNSEVHIKVHGLVFDKLMDSQGHNS